MKKIRVVAFVVLAIALGVVALLFNNSQDYGDFTQARIMAAKGVRTPIHIVGTLKKDALNNPVDFNYNPRVNPDSLSFKLVDQDSTEAWVVYANAKPADLEKSDKVVVEGAFDGEYFVASSILLKCPSKYENEGLEN